MNLCNEKTKIIIFVGCHPDDIEIGCGGTIACFIESGEYEVWCIILTKGEKGLGPNNSSAVRVKESIEALTLLGVSQDHIIFGDFKDTHVPDSVEVIQFLEKYNVMNSQEVCAVFVPSPKDSHQDHRFAAQASITAFRNIRQVLTYESPSVSSVFSPTSFVDITKYITKKKNSLRCHKSQIQQAKTYLEYRAMMCVSAFRGLQIGGKYAEAFETLRYLIEP